MQPVLASPSAAALLQLPFVTVYHHPLASALEVSWRNTPNSSQLRSVLQMALRLAQQLQTRAWIGDVQQLNLLVADDYSWLERVWLPQLADTAVCALAVVLPTESPTAEVYGTVINRLLSGEAPLCTRFFFSSGAARDWVSQLP